VASGPPPRAGPRRSCVDIRHYLEQMESTAMERMHRARERERERQHVRGEAQPLIFPQQPDDATSTAAAAGNDSILFVLAT